MNAVANIKRAQSYLQMALTELQLEINEEQDLFRQGILMAQKDALKRRMEDLDEILRLL